QAPEHLSNNFRIPDDTELEQQIASEVAAQDPERGLKIARESLAKGLSFELLNLLYELIQNSDEVGTKFAGEIVNKIHTRNISTDHYASRIAADLVVWSRPAAAAPVESNWVPRKRLELDKETRRQLVDQLTNAALGISPNGNVLYAISEILPEVQEFVPERVALLERKLALFNQTLNKEQRGWNEYNSLVRGGSPEEMMKAALRAGDEQREMLQQQAIVVAVFRRRADAVREIINAEIEDESRRKNLIDMLDSEQINSAVYNGKTEELRKLIPSIRLKEERARAMAELAIVMERKGEHEEAVKLLDEAEDMVKTDLQSLTQTNALLTLMAAYALVDPPKAFAIVERTIDRANDDISKLLLVDKILKSGAIKKGEFVLQNSNAISFDFAMFQYGRGVSALAYADFERTKAAADRLNRNELRLLARLMLATAILRKQVSTERMSEE
ncbi:MAG TPA: hypothetical protein VGW36_07285, partial [Pyrinomonadaceae bacterium]|nr:hypothetical protein [Pyrinomonadaceae bacterium]